MNTMRTITIPLLAFALSCWGQAATQSTATTPASAVCALEPISTLTHGELIKIVWASPACQLAEVRVFRRIHTVGEEAEVHPAILITKRNDSTIVHCLDTLFTELAIYQYRAVAVDSLGTEGPSSPWVTAHNLHQEVAPKLHSIRIEDVPNERSVRIHWGLQNSIRARGVVIYRAEKYDGPYLPIAELPSTDTVYIDRLRLVKEVYFYRIEVVDVMGYSSVSIPFQGLSDTEPVVAPPLSVLAQAEPHGITLSWPYADPDIAHYKVERARAGEEKWLLVTDGLRAPADGPVQWTDSSATKNRVWRYRVRAVSIGGPISEPSEVETIQAWDNSVPSSPTDVAVRRLDEHAVIISWRDIWAGDIGAFRANVERADTGSTEFVVLNKVPLDAGNTVFFDSTALSGKPYTYRVVGVSSSGTHGIPSLTAELKGINLATTGPSMLLAHRESDGIALQWPARERQGKSFNLYRSVDDAEPELLKNLPIDASSYLDSSMVEGAMHLYVIALVLPDGTETNMSEPVGVRWE